MNGITAFGDAGHTPKPTPCIKICREVNMRMRTSFPDRLGIDLRSKKEAELFKWFLACLLFGKPIQTEIAERAYHRLVAEHLTGLEAILHAGWDKLVILLDEAHYVRYDFSTATKLLDVCRELKQRYQTMMNLLAHARTPAELSFKLQEFKHVGPVTARIFLRGVSPFWYRRLSHRKISLFLRCRGSGIARF